jgi:hypothetical protein
MPSAAKKITLFANGADAEVVVCAPARGAYTNPAISTIAMTREKIFFFTGSLLYIYFGSFKHAG